LFLHDTKKYFCFVVWWFDRKKKTKKQRWKYVSFFLESFFFQGGMFFLFFKGGGSNLLYIFFSFLEVVTAYSYVTGKQLFWIFFRFKFRKFRFWFLMLHQCIEREPDDFTYFLLWYVFFWLLMIFFVDKIKFVLLRWCYFKVYIKLQLSLRTKLMPDFFKIGWSLEKWSLVAHQSC